MASALPVEMQWSRFPKEERKKSLGSVRGWMMVDRFCKYWWLFDIAGCVVRADRRREPDMKKALTVVVDGRPVGPYVFFWSLRRKKGSWGREGRNEK